MNIVIHVKFAVPRNYVQSLQIDLSNGRIGHHRFVLARLYDGFKMILPNPQLKELPICGLTVGYGVLHVYWLYSN
jgi:hypothetical protein